MKQLRLPTYAGIISILKSPKFRSKLEEIIKITNSGVEAGFLISRHYNSGRLFFGEIKVGDEDSVPDIYTPPLHIDIINFHSHTRCDDYSWICPSSDPDLVWMSDAGFHLSDLSKEGYEWFEGRGDYPGPEKCFIDKIKYKKARDFVKKNVSGLTTWRGFNAIAGVLNKKSVVLVYELLPPESCWRLIDSVRVGEEGGFKNQEDVMSTLEKESRFVRLIEY